MNRLDQDFTVNTMRITLCGLCGCGFTDNTMDVTTQSMHVSVYVNTLYIN